MQIELEQQDIDAIAQKVVEFLKPFVSGNGKNEDKEIILTTEILSKYLQVGIPWIYKLLSRINYAKTIQFREIGTRGRLATP